jgi:putative ABC transport system ATP-binding protein
LRLEAATRLYRMGDAEVRALDGLSLVIRRGEFVAVMGPSGSGKSTLLNVLGCLDRPTSGRYLLEGQEVQSLSETQLAEVRRRCIGFIFQSYHLVPRMSAARNVELPLVLAGMPPRERRERVRAMLDSVGLLARAAHRPDQMSGGERQRVAIARAMAGSPALLLADEPTGNLDTRTADEIMALLQRLHHAGLTIVMVTHDPRMGAHAERRLGMVDGRLASDVLLTSVVTPP